MDIRQFRLFAVLAEELHFGRAADKLHIAQSALTTQIQRLEEELATPLLIRNRRAPIKLTLAGEVFLLEANKALAQFEHAMAVGQRAGRGEIGLIKVGYVASALFAGVLSRFVHGFHQKFPDVDIVFQELETPRQIEAVQNGEIDVGFVRLRCFPKELATLDILSEELVLAIRRGHSLPLRNGRVAPTTLSALPFVVTLTEKGPGLYGNVLALAREGGFSPNIAFHVQNLTTLLAVVSSGLAAAVVPTSLQMIHLRDVDYIPLDTVPLVERLALIRSRTNTSSVAEQFFKFCGAL